VPWIRLEEREVLVHECPDTVGKLAVVEPKVRVGEMGYSGVQRPAS